MSISNVSTATSTRGLERTGLALVLGFLALAAAAAALAPRLRLEMLSFVLAAAVVAVLVLRFSGATLAASLALCSALLVTGLDTWLRLQPTLITGLVWGLATVAAAFLWHRAAGFVVATLALALVLLVQLWAYDAPAQELIDLSFWVEAWSDGRLMPAVALLVVAAAATALPPRFPVRVPRPRPLSAQRPRISAQLLEALPHAAALYDRHSQLLGTNSAWRRLHEATPDDPSGEHSGTLELHHRGSDTFRRCLEGQTFEGEPTQLLRASGESDWVRTSMSPWYEEGELVRIGGVLVTKTLASEEMALRSELEEIRLAAWDRNVADEPAPQPAVTEDTLDTLLAQYLRLFSDVFFVLDAEGRVREMHTQPGAHGDLAALDLVGEPLGDMFPAFFEWTQPSKLEALRKSGDLAQVDFELPRAAGEPPTRFSALLGTLGEGFAAMVRPQPAAVEAPAPPAPEPDPDDRQFTSAAAHDLQEPLRNVNSYLQLLESRKAHLLDPEGREFLGFALEGAYRMQGILTGLLDYARAGFAATGPTRVELERAFEKAMTGLEHQIEKTDAVLRTEELPDVLASFEDVSLIFQNLVSNALKYRSAERPEISVSAVQHNGLVEVSVRDNGIGIPEDEAERVFAPFERLHTESEAPGSGLGLAICRRLVERHGGKIWIEGGAEGTLVQFTLPPAEASAE